MDIHVAKAEADKQAVLRLRLEVFVEEQNVPPDIELDAADAHATHIIAISNGMAVGCARVLFSAQEAHIGRFAVKRSHRNQGIGREVYRFVVAYCRERSCTDIWLNAQLSAVGFYEKLGFQPQGDVFTEAGIAHVKMIFPTLP